MESPHDWRMKNQLGRKPNYIKKLINGVFFLYWITIFVPLNTTNRFHTFISGKLFTEKFL